MSMSHDLLHASLHAQPTDRNATLFSLIAEFQRSLQENLTVSVVDFASLCDRARREIPDTPLESLFDAHTRSVVDAIVCEPIRKDPKKKNLLSHIRLLGKSPWGLLPWLVIAHFGQQILQKPTFLEKLLKLSTIGQPFPSVFERLWYHCSQRQPGLAFMDATTRAGVWKAIDCQRVLEELRPEQDLEAEQLGHVIAQAREEKHMTRATTEHGATSLAAQEPGLAQRPIVEPGRGVAPEQEAAQELTGAQEQEPTLSHRAAQDTAGTVYHDADTQEVRAEPSLADLSSSDVELPRRQRSPSSLRGKGRRRFRREALYSRSSSEDLEEIASPRKRTKLIRSVTPNITYEQDSDADSGGPPLQITVTASSPRPLFPDDGPSIMSVSMNADSQTLEVRGDAATTTITEEVAPSHEVEGEGADTLQPAAMSQDQTDTVPQTAHPQPMSTLVSRDTHPQPMPTMVSQTTYEQPIHTIVPAADGKAPSHSIRGHASGHGKESSQSIRGHASGDGKESSQSARNIMQDAATAAASLQPGRQLTGTAVDHVLRMVLPPSYIVVEYVWTTRLNPASSLKEFRNRTGLKLPPMLVPMCHDNIHWTSAHVLPEIRTCYITDSLPNSRFRGSTDRKTRQFCKEIPGHKTQEWRLIYPHNAPMQADSSSCGLFVLLDALLRSNHVQTPEKIDVDVLRHVFMHILHAMFPEECNEAPHTLPPALQMPVYHAPDPARPTAGTSAFVAHSKQVLTDQAAIASHREKLTTLLKRQLDAIVTVQTLELAFSRLLSNISQEISLSQQATSLRQFFSGAHNTEHTVALLDTDGLRWVAGQSSKLSRQQAIIEKVCDYVRQADGRLQSEHARVEADLASSSSTQPSGAGQSSKD